MDTVGQGNNLILEIVEYVNDYIITSNGKSVFDL
jgi:hypothetical protein